MAIKNRGANNKRHKMDARREDRRAKKAATQATQNGKGVRTRLASQHGTSGQISQQA